MSERLHVWDRLRIGGHWVAPSGDGVFEVVCPSTEEVVGRVPEGTATKVDRAVAAAHQAFEAGDWSRRSPVDRAKVLAEMSRVLGERAGKLANLVTTEIGAPVAPALADQVQQPIGTVD